MSQETYEAKKGFVTHELSRCIAASCPGVVRLEYHANDDGRAVEEVVVIRFATGYTQRVTVTDHDARATMQDVLDALEGQPA